MYQVHNGKYLGLHEIENNSLSQLNIYDHDWVVKLNIIKTGEGTVYKLTLVNADRKLFKGHIVVAILSQQ